MMYPAPVMESRQNLPTQASILSSWTSSRLRAGPHATPIIANPRVIDNNLVLWSAEAPLAIYVWFKVVDAAPIPAIARPMIRAARESKPPASPYTNMPTEPRTNKVIYGSFIGRRSDQCPTTGNIIVLVSEKDASTIPSIVFEPPSERTYFHTVGISREYSTPMEKVEVNSKARTHPLSLRVFPILSLVGYRPRSKIDGRHSSR
mmetsp:Transcript_33711/g.54289  ORF Transcript_33711/g.54289 Transcript_33711/m.54289 type:complete len:204 (+) Transcript_33711:1173-1784(+)